MKYINTNKLENFKLNKENVFIVLDFDKTITSFESKDSWDVCGRLLGTEFTDKLNEYYQYYSPIEIDYNMDNLEKQKYMLEWYYKSINLYYEYKLTQDKLKSSIKQSKIDFRQGAKEFLEEANKSNIPLVILSAGIGNIIEEFLKINGCYFDNMYIISNFIEFDENGNMKQFEDEMIHSLNKTIEGHLSNEMKEKIDQKQYGLLVGDLIDDKKMIPNNKKRDVITIGLLMDDYNLKIYNENFDIVLDKEDATFENVEKLVF